MDYIFKDVFVINTHANAADYTRTVPGNIMMIKSLPGVSIPTVVSNMLFGAFTNVTSPITYSAEYILKIIKDYYKSQPDSPEFYGKIYSPSEIYTDNLLEFDESYKDEDSGDILHITDNIDHKTIKKFRDIVVIREQIIDSAKYNIDKQKFIVNISDLINTLNLYMEGNPYLLVVVSCSYIDETYDELTQEAAEQKIPITILSSVLNKNNYYKKYLKYKQKYFDLKNLN